MMPAKLGGNVSAFAASRHELQAQLNYHPLPVKVAILCSSNDASSGMGVNFSQAQASRVSLPERASMCDS